MTTTYAWLITHDHITKSDEGGYAGGTNGPRDAPQELLDRLERGQGHTFRLYDDDGERYYTGRGIWDDYPEAPGEDAAYGPLGDFGAAWAGCTLIKWHGHSDWDCA